MMKMAFDGIVLNAVTQQLKEEIETGRISKLYTISQYEILMIIRAHNKNKKCLVSIHPTYARIQLTQLDEYTIRLAAKIAAYYSKGRLSSSVPVNYAQVRTLKKPHTNKPGLVLLSNYKTIYIDPDDTFLTEVTKK